MNWLQVRIDLGELRAEPVEQALLDMGAVTIQYSDAGDNPIFEPAPGTTPLWNTTQMSALFEVGVSETAIQLIVAKSITPAPIPSIYFTLLEEQDWVASWKRNLPPMQFGQHLWICPPGSTCPDDRATIVTIEPGLGFGTGAHATTRLCLEWLSQRQLRDKTVLDLGCGSGILGIASLALGASRVTAVDIDEHALTATRENAQRNDCLAQLQVLLADRLDPSIRFDLIVANILSGTLIELESDLRGHSQSGTDIALSGILTSQADEVVSAYERWIHLKHSAEQGDWVILTGAIN
jgi:ribosomal protein L11 methyltransferase